MNRTTIGALTTFVLAAILLAVTPLHAADRMQPGKWQKQMMSGGRTSTSTMCVTPEKAASVNGDTKSARAAALKAMKAMKASERCVINAYDVSGDTVSYSMVCQGTRIESTTTYHGGIDYVGTMKTTDEGETHTMGLKGHRLGSCGAK